MTRTELKELLMENFEYLPNDNVNRNHICINLINWLSDCLSYEEDMTGYELLNQAEIYLGDVNCQGASGPAPIYNHELAKELGEYWVEITEALKQFNDATGEHWTPHETNILFYVWFAYEWFASELMRFVEDEKEKFKKAA